LDVAPLLDETLRIVNETFPRNIGVHSVVAPGTSSILGDATQLQQVLLNLCVNARDAMPDGGRLSVNAMGVTLDAETAARTLGAKAGPYVVITVEDTGSGIAPEHLEKVFDPFFTTKPVGEGTGLGLSTTLAIVKSHDGFLRVHSVLGAGTRVEVYLPGYLATSVLDKHDANTEAPRGHGETVLVVDDEPAIRETTRLALEAHGYQVLEATNGADAIATCARHSQEMRVAVIDLMMPVMGGVAAIQILQRLAPRVRIIAVSGLAATRDVQQALSSGASEFLAKPYTAAALLHAIARALGQDSTAPSPDTSQTIPPAS
jgi:CheY-like chemotaxis protein